jgi:hypothetical protein
MKRSFITAAILCSATAVASSTGEGILRGVHFMSNGVVIAYTSGTKVGSTPSCAASYPNRFALDGTSAGGKVQVAGLLAAYAAGKAVIIIGSGDCSVYGDTETISYFFTADL